MMAYDFMMAISRLQEPEEHIFISSYLPVTPVLQNGPRCGLVALSMASELTNSQPVSTEQIFQKAQDRGYSKQGEMFTAQGLEKLCTLFLTCRVRHIQSNEDEKLRNLICSFLKKNLVLIPYPIIKKKKLKQVSIFDLYSYDSDKDHSPCKKNGHKAHWALLTGVFTMLKSKDVPDWLTSHCERDSKCLIFTTGLAVHHLSSVIELLNLTQQYCDNMHVFGHHGKSKCVVSGLCKSC
ncbi:hypothetical protein Btru_055389 [Bulinus truncatus]|nr:hypothetical protein Btru_055389 [Bulinus truncatus]